MPGWAAVCGTYCRTDNNRIMKTLNMGVSSICLEHTRLLTFLCVCQVSFLQAFHSYTSTEGKIIGAYSCSLINY